MSLKEVKNIAKGLRDSDQGWSGLRLHADSDSVTPRSKLSSARKQIVLSPSETPVSKPKNVDGGSIKLPEKYEMLAAFFISLHNSIRLLRMKGSVCTFTNICPKVESLTDRRFSYRHLAQLKSILPEAIVIKKVLSLDERTSCMKPDLHVTLEADAIENDGKRKSGNGNLDLKKVFRARLLDFVKSHPEGDEIPEVTLPEPFGRLKQELRSETTEGSNSTLLVEASSNAAFMQKPTVASHVSQTFQRRFSKKISCDDAEKTLQNHSEDSSQPSVLPVPEPCLNRSSPAIACAASSSINYCSKPTSSDTGINFKSSPHIVPSRMPATPIKEPIFSKNVKSSPAGIASISGTPAKLNSTPAKLMASTPALQTPKRCYMSPDDNSNKSPNKLVRRALRTRSLTFDTPVKLAKVEDVNETGCLSIDSDIFDILPENLLQSIKEKERKAMEERDPAISQAKRRRDMIASLPKLFNIIHFFFQSIKRSIVTKEELIYKIITSHSDIVDRRELEEQLQLLQELVPEWISEKLASSGDYLLGINKATDTKSLRARLAEAN